MAIEDLKTSYYDTANFLDSEEMINEYIQASIGNEREFLEALSCVARVRIMEQIAEKTGIARDDVFKIFNLDAIESFAQVNKILKALNVDFVLEKTSFLKERNFSEEKESSMTMMVNYAGAF